MARIRRIGLSLRSFLLEPKYQQVSVGVRRYARERPDWRCIVDEIPGNPATWVPRSTEPYDGFIARATVPLREVFAARGIPVVNTLYGADRPDAAGAYIDPRACGRLLADHLIDHGFARLAYVVEDTFALSHHLAEAFAQTAEELGHTCEAALVDTGAGGQSEIWGVMREPLATLLDRLRPPVGILVTMPIAARVLVALCDERRLRVAQDVAIVCTQDVPGVLTPPPSITSIDCGYEQAGYEAAALLYEIMEHPGTPPRQVRVPPRGIVARESTDYFAVEDELVAEALRVISGHLRDDLSVIALADQLQVSQRTLQRRFKQAMGRGIAGEVRRLRLESAKRLLTNQQLAIGQIARQVGFGSATTMNLLFHRELGMSPRDYRKQLAQR